MRIKRLELKVEYDTHSVGVFHTDLKPNPDPPTIIVIDGKEYEGHLMFEDDNDTFIIKIKAWK